MLHRHDRDRFLATLLATRHVRPHLWALLAFNFEIARVAETVSQPLLGQIRLQWWRDALDEIEAGKPVRRHFVAEPLAAAIRACSIDRTLLDAMIDAREAQDLGTEPPATLEALERYGEATSAGLLRAELRVLGADAASEAARHVGIAWALVGLVRAAPAHERANRRYVPADLADPGQPLQFSDAGTRNALRALVEAGDAHLNSARLLVRRAPRAALPALAIARRAKSHIDRLRAAGYDPTTMKADRSPAGVAASLWLFRLTRAI